MVKYLMMALDSLKICFVFHGCVDLKDSQKYEQQPYDNAFRSRKPLRVNNARTTSLEFQIGIQPTIIRIFVGHSVIQPCPLFIHIHVIYLSASSAQLARFLTDNREAWLRPQILMVERYTALPSYIDIRQGSSLVLLSLASSFPISQML